MAHALPDAPITRLRRVRAALEAGQAVPGPDAAWMADALARYDAHGVGLEQALGMTRQGGTSWREAEALHQRNALLVRLHRDHLPNLSPGAAAAEIARLAGRVNPRAVRLADVRLQLIAEAMRAAGRFPGRKRLRAILTGHSVGL